MTPRAQADPIPAHRGMDDAVTFWEAMFKESEQQGWPQAYIAIPKVAYRKDKRVIEKIAKEHGFSRVLFTGDKSHTHFCRYV